MWKLGIDEQHRDRQISDCCTDEKGKRSLETETETKNGFH